MVETSIDESTSACTIREVRNADASLRGVPETFLCDSESKKKLLHVLVGSAGQRRKTANLVTHLRVGPYPKNAFRRYSHDVLIASPELCFFEMATELSFPKLVEFGCFLCGTYTLNPHASIPNGRQPLTTKARLETFVEDMGNERGSAVAKRALELVLDGSASPRETKIALLLCFPVRLGGYGFEQPLMNYQIDFNVTEKRLFGRSRVVLDLYWYDSRLGIEYDGSSGHTEEADLARDRKKSGELNYRGINVLRVDKEQVSNPYGVYVLAKKCARLMGIIVRKPTNVQLARRRMLFDILMK